MPGKPIVMTSNLPLLFVKGRPRSLESLDLDELEEFVEFIILCSLKIEINDKPADYNTLPVPEWWPDIPFQFPLGRNCKPDQKQSTLKKLVCRCYTFYDCEFYLKFSSELSEKLISEMTFQKNPQEKTTTILDAEGNVLVKCRDENFCYDKRKTRRTQVITTRQATSSSPDVTYEQPKRIPPLIDLTYESSGDEAEVCFKQPIPVKVQKFKQSSKALTNSHSQSPTKKKQLPQENVGTSKSPYSRTSSKGSLKKKLLFENYRKQDSNPNTPIEEPTPENISRKRKRNVLLPMTRKKRRFEDFSCEEPEPDLFTKDEFMSKLCLAPQKQETAKLDLKIEGKRKLSQSFSLLTLTSQRGQALLARNDRLNMAVSLDRNSKYCGTHHQEEEELNQMCTRSNDPSQFFKNKDLIPSKRTAIIKKGYSHSYKWPRRTKNIVYPPRGPSIKDCSVQICRLSKSMIQFWVEKKSEKTTMTPDLWRYKNSTICTCQNIPMKLLANLSISNLKTKSSSTRCMCIGSTTQSKPQTNSQEMKNSDSFNKEMISSELTVIGNHKNVAEELSCKNKNFTNTCDSARQMNVSYLDEKETFCGFSLIHSEPLLSSKRVLHRRPLAVVPPEPITINEELAVTTSVTYLPDNISTAPSIKHNNVFRSLSDAIKWYTKDEPIEVSDHLRESLPKEGTMFGTGTDRSQENIKPFTDMTLPDSKTPVDYFKINVNLAERDYCFVRSSCGASKLVTRRGERHYVNREPCPSCFQGKDNFCVFEFIRQAKLAGITLLKNPKQLKLLFFKYVQALNTKD